MTREADRPVLAVMTKAPLEGHVKTRLSSGFAPRAIVALYEALVEDTIDLARSLSLQVVCVCPSADAPAVRAWIPPDVSVLPQDGSGLAAGLVSTFQQLCTVSRRPVVAFNGDGPHLAPAVLESAFAALREADVVVGPCDDGGYYLVGATRPHAGLFDAEVMGTRSACEALLQRAFQLGLRTAVTAEHYDIDFPDDVLRLARELAGEPQRAPRTAGILAAWQIASPRANS